MHATFCVALLASALGSGTEPPGGKSPPASPPAQAPADTNATNAANVTGEVSPRHLNVPPTSTATATTSSATLPSSETSSTAGMVETSSATTTKQATSSSAVAGEIRSTEGPLVSSASPTEPDATLDPLGVESDAIQFKPGKGLLFESRNGNFGMALRSRVQLRYELEHVEVDDPATAHVLSVRRARFQVAGHMFSRHIKYKLQLALSPQDMQFGPAGARNSPVLDAIVTFDRLRDLTINVGQFMVPFNRQRIISSGNFELVDRSLGNAEFQQDRDIGIQASSDDIGGLGYLRYVAGVFMGEGRDAFVHDDAGLLYVGRFEAVPTGNSKNRWDYTEGDLEHLATPRVSLGAAYAYLDRTKHNRGVPGNVPTDGGTTNMHLVTADVVARWRGLSLSAEFYLRSATREFGDAMVEDDQGNPVPAAEEAARNGLGWYAQLGYVLTPVPLGVAGRYSQVRGRSDSSLGDTDEIAAGPSWYMYGHDMKLQADYTRRWSPGDDAAEAEHLVRVQLTAGF